jgi:hypothetical protein
MNNTGQEHGLGAGHEVTDVPARPLAGIAIAVVILVGSSFLLMAILFKAFDYYQPLFDEVPHPLAQARANDSTPRLQIDPPNQKVELKEIENRVLTGYDWIDKDAGIVRIPIDRAIGILAAKSGKN